MRPSPPLLVALLLVPSVGWGQDGILRKSFKAHPGPVELIAFRPGGKQLVTASGKDVVLWDAATGARVREFKGHTKAVKALAFSGDGKTLATAGSAVDHWKLSAAGIGKVVRVWDAESGKPVATLTLPTPLEVAALALTADGKLLATWGYPAQVAPAHSVVVWDLSKLPATNK